MGRIARVAVLTAFEVALPNGLATHDLARSGWWTVRGASN